jgi:hypothetical protein
MQGCEKLSLILEAGDGLAGLHAGREEMVESFPEFGIVIDEVFEMIANVFAAISYVFPLIAHILAPVADIFETIPRAGVCFRIANVFAPVQHIFALVAHVLAPVAYVFPTIANILTLIPRQRRPGRSGLPLARLRQ